MLGCARLAITSASRKKRLIRVEGFASSDGQEGKNMDLSMLRAVAVKNYLEQKAIAVDLYISGFGENSPATGKLSEQRRVDIATYDIVRVQ